MQKGFMYIDTCYEEYSCIDNPGNLKIKVFYRADREWVRFILKKELEPENCSNEEALKKLLKTMTYELLQDKESSLYAESPEYVWSMLKDEEYDNLESWIKE